MLKYPEMLDIAAKYISIKESEDLKLKTPLANINVNITLTLESSETVLAPSYLTLMNEVGPGKGGLRIHKNVTAASNNKPTLPSLPVHPKLDKKTSRRLRSIVLFSLNAFAISFVLGYIVCAITARSFEFWHVFNWFI